MSVKISQMQSATTDFLKDASSPKLEVSVNQAGIGNVTRSASKEVLTHRIFIPEILVGQLNPPNSDFVLLQIPESKVQELSRYVTDSQNVGTYQQGQVLCFSGHFHLQFSTSDFESYQFASIPFFVSMDSYGNMAGNYVSLISSGYFTPHRRNIPDYAGSDYYSFIPTIGIRSVNTYTPPVSGDIAIEVSAYLLYDQYAFLPVPNLRISGYVDVDITSFNTPSAPQ